MAGKWKGSLTQGPDGIRTGHMINVYTVNQMTLKGRKKNYLGNTEYKWKHHLTHKQKLNKIKYQSQPTADKETKVVLAMYASEQQGIHMQKQRHMLSFIKNESKMDRNKPKYRKCIKFVKPTQL